MNQDKLAKIITKQVLKAFQKESDWNTPKDFKQMAIYYLAVPCEVKSEEAKLEFTESGVVYIELPEIKCKKNKYRIAMNSGKDGLGLLIGNSKTGEIFSHIKECYEKINELEKED